jgi:uncharacterized Zn finger protein
MGWRRGRYGGRWDDWEDWDYPSVPRRPANGIKAQTQRGKFGATWWASRWLAALEQLVDAARLSRGRSYARSGQVTKLDVGPGGVDALVQGSRPKPYAVTMRFRPLSDAKWDAVADAMAAEALYAARLLSGEMPEQIEEAFRAAGATLFPAAAGDLETDCTCPDWANPCKHVAAVFYLLGERFDADPFLMFELRGRTKDEIAAALRSRRAGGAAGSQLRGGSPDEPGRPGGPDTQWPEEQEEPEEAVPLLGASAGSGQALDVAPAARQYPGTEGAVDAFWSAPAALADVAIAFSAPAVDALPVKLLGPPPSWPSDQDFTAVVEQAYKAIGERALRLAIES